MRQQRVSMDHFDRSALLQFHQQVELFGSKNGGALHGIYNGVGPVAPLAYGGCMPSRHPPGRRSHMRWPHSNRRSSSSDQ